jgi:hypothetical protein
MNQTLKVLKTRFPNANIFGSKAEAIDWFARNLA